MYFSRFLSQILGISNNYYNLLYMYSYTCRCTLLCLFLFCFSIFLLSPSLSSSLPLLLIDQFPLISDDLVNSHYLLLCCIDMLCAAAIIGKRQELLSPDFTPPSLPAVTPDCDSAHSLPMDDYPTIIPELCRQFSGNYMYTCTCICTCSTCV